MIVLNAVRVIAQNHKFSILVFCQGSTVFDPIAVIGIQDAIDVAHFGFVNVPAYYAIEATLFGMAGGSRLESANIFLSFPKTHFDASANGCEPATERLA